MNLAILSPAFPPAINGLGDYSYLLGQEIEKQLPQATIFYLGLQQSEVVTLTNYVSFEKKNLSQIINTNQINLLFINYSNYGYQKKGVPVWLVKEVATIKAMGVKVITFFHEVYASGKVWQSVFWLHQVQKKIFQNLYYLSDAVFCSNQRVQTIIQSETKDKGSKSQNIGLFSNITEPNVLIPWANREKVAVVFGSYGRRKLVYDKIVAINKFCKQTDLVKIIDIGNGKCNEEWQKIQVPVIAKGILPNVEIAAILANIQFGFIDYATSLLGKSGIFAAYAAFGIVPINFTDDNEKAMDGLNVDIQFYEPKYIPLNFNSGAIFSWYQQRNIVNHTKAIIASLN